MSKEYIKPGMTAYAIKGQATMYTGSIGSCSSHTCDVYCDVLTQCQSDVCSSNSLFDTCSEDGDDCPLDGIGPSQR